MITANIQALSGEKIMTAEERVARMKEIEGEFMEPG
jgi:hypothetical protein